MSFPLCKQSCWSLNLVWLNWGMTGNRARRTATPLPRGLFLPLVGFVCEISPRGVKGAGDVIFQTGKNYCEN